jgi:hypothetical protein
VPTAVDLLALHLLLFVPAELAEAGSRVIR